MIRAVGTIDAQDLMRKTRRSPIDLLAQARRPPRVACEVRSVPITICAVRSPHDPSDFARAAAHVTAKYADALRRAGLPE